MRTYKISPDDLVQGNKGGVEPCEALVDRLEVGVADVNHRVGGVQSAQLSHDVPDDVLAVLVERGDSLQCWEELSERHL